MNLRHLQTVFRFEKKSKNHIPSLLKKAGFVAETVIFKTSEKSLVIYKKPYLNASVKENYVTISAESDRKTLIFPKQLPEFIQLLNALNPYLQPESISILIQQKEKNIPQWYSFLKEKKLFQPYTVGEHEVGLLCCGKEIRIECFPYSNQWLFTLNHIKSPIVRKLGEGFPMNTEVIKKAISWLCELFLKFHKEK